MRWHKELSELKCPLDSRRPYVHRPGVKRESMSEEERRKRNAESHRRCYDPIKTSIRKKEYYQKVKSLRKAKRDAKKDFCSF